MKLSEVKSVGKKIILLVFCVVLLLIFTSLSYGWGPNPKYDRLRGHPEQELLSPPNGDQFDDVLLVIITNWNNFSLVICTKIDSPKENPALQSLATQEVKSKSNNDVKRPR
jgi:hypothetical protein